MYYFFVSCRFIVIWEKEYLNVFVKLFILIINIVVIIRRILFI